MAEHPLRESYKGRSTLNGLFQARFSDRMKWSAASWPWLPAILRQAIERGGKKEQNTGGPLYHWDPGEGGIQGRKKVLKVIGLRALDSVQGFWPLLFRRFHCSLGLGVDGVLCLASFLFFFCYFWLLRLCGLFSFVRQKHLVKKSLFSSGFVLHLFFLGHSLALSRHFKGTESNRHGLEICNSTKTKCQRKKKSEQFCVSSQ